MKNPLENVDSTSNVVTFCLLRSCFVTPHLLPPEQTPWDDIRAFWEVLQLEQRGTAKLHFLSESPQQHE